MYIVNPNGFYRTSFCCKLIDVDKSNGGLRFQFDGREMLT